MRRRRAEVRKVTADAQYSSEIINKFINLVMIKGKKTTAQRIVYDALQILKEKAGKEPVSVFYQALENARPKLEVHSRRIGGATYQVPVEVTKERGVSIALRWIRDYARGKKGKTMASRLADEVFSCYKQEGSVIKKRDDTHKMAEANKAFAHFKW